LVGKPGRKRPLGRPRSKGEDNIAMDPKRKCCFWLRTGTRDRELGIMSCFEADGRNSGELVGKSLPPRKRSHCLQKALQTVNTFEDVNFPELNGVDTGRLLGIAHGMRGRKL
jgi:hypothetical protein